jgi:PIN domain nuclease of toxin-antitoxin system
MGTILMLVLDTCALLWHTLDPGRLSPAALSAIEAADTLLVSSISLWEVALKAKKHELELPMEIEAYAALVEQVDHYRILPVEGSHWLASVHLEWEHRDPADRLIVALAGLFHAGLVTRDVRMLKWYPMGVW